MWGHQAAAFTTNGVYNHNVAKPITVLFVGGLMKSYQGTVSLLSSLRISPFFKGCFALNSPESFVPTISGTYYLSGNTASRWYFDPHIPEAQQFSTGCVLSAYCSRRSSLRLQHPRLNHLYTDVIYYSIQLPGTEVRLLHRVRTRVNSKLLYSA